MSTSKGVKRKAASIGEKSKSSKKFSKRPEPVVESEDDNDGFEDLENGEADEEDIDVDPGMYNDPMIDPIGSSDEDEDEEHGVDEDEEEEEDQPQAGPSRSQVPRQTTKSLYSVPTMEELDHLQSATSMGNNTFTLQTEALLNKTLLPETPHPALKSLLSKIHDLILGIPDVGSMSPKEAEGKMLGGVPWVGGDLWDPTKGGGPAGEEEGKKGVQWKVGFTKPSEVLVGGSWGVAGGYKKGKGEIGGIDFVVVMPNSMFSPKDRMNYRYFQKRVFYLSVIQSAIAKAAKKDVVLKGIKVEWNTEIDARRPVLVISAGKDQGLKHSVEITIHASINPDVFPISTLSLNRSLLRLGSEFEDASTPLYSSSLIQDTLHKTNLLYLHRLSTLIGRKELSSFLALWRIWCSRKNISRGRGGSAYFAGMLMGWIVDGGDVGVGRDGRVKRVRGLGKSLGYWGAIRAAWEFLAHTDFEATPIFMLSEESALVRNSFMSTFKDIFVDPTGSLNIFAGWEKGDIQILQHHARETLAMLEDAGVDHFDEVFLRDSRLGPQAYDESIRVDITSSTFTPDQLEESERPSNSLCLAHKVASILRQGLSDRVKLVHVHPTSENHLDIGMIYNGPQATRVLDLGPGSDKPAEGATFRKLWGEKAELRRFKDGSISESVVWDISRPEDATTIPSRIVQWLLQRHFGIPADDISTWSSESTWSSIVQTPASARNAISVQGSEKLGFRPIMDAYDELYRLLKSIDSELPLAILNVTPADESLRYSSTFVPHPVDLNRYPTAPDSLKYLPKADIVLQFESSPRWPDDLSAIQKVKLAMMEKISRVIMAKLPKTTAGVVLDTTYSEIQDHASLEVIMPKGVVFHIRIYHEKEKTLLERIIDDDTPVFGTSLPRPPRRLAIPALLQHIQRFHYRPNHHNMMSPLHHRYPSYSAGTRLLKRWFGGHMFSLLVPGEAIELIMAHEYLNPGGLGIPASATTGFVRAMKHLANWEYTSTPMFVPVQTAARDEAAEKGSGRVRFPSSKRQDAMEMYEKRAKNDTSHPWSIITEEDLEGHRWTTGVGLVVAARVKVLAKATLAALEQQIETNTLSVTSLFKSPLSDYDVVLYLQASLITRSAQAIDPDEQLWESRLQFRNLTDSGVLGGQPSVNLNPAESLARDIQRLYGDALLVFYDVHGGQAIGLLWNPTKNAPRALKPFLGYNTKPDGSEAALVEVNKQAVMAEILRLGKGLISKVEVQR